MFKEAETIASQSDSIKTDLEGVSKKVANRIMGRYKAGMSDF